MDSRREWLVLPRSVGLVAVSLLAAVAIYAILVAVPRPSRALPHRTALSAVASAAATTTPGPTASTAPMHTSATVVGIGDSVTSAAVCQCTGFVELVAGQLWAAAGGPGHAVNLGKGGLTSADLRRSITKPGPTSSAAAQADILLVTIGANDLTPLLLQRRTSGCPAACYAPAVDAVEANLRAILGAARTLRGHQPTQVLVTDYWNVFADGDVARAANGTAYLRWSDELTRALNARICRAATSTGATCVDLYAPFKGDGERNPTEFLAGDGDHPNAAGHQLIASALIADIRPPLH